MFLDKQPSYWESLNSASWPIQAVQVVRPPHESYCGVMVCQFIKYLLWNGNVPQWVEGDCSSLRLTTAWELLESRVRW
jgi:hypothetical protein